ncbi:MAG: hypothetical protein OEM99_11520 [Gammaproteobacteria bacterium]|nr:hypothetical protein [Gammaproteobacteria bacterium]
MSPKSIWLRFLVITLLLVCPLLAAADEGGSVLGDYWGVRIGLNYSSWDGLGDLEPAAGGPFETSGNGLEFEVYSSIAKMENNWLLAGATIGLLGFNTSLLEGDFPDESALDATHVDVFLKYRFGEPDQNYFDIDVGLGYYVASTMYIQCRVIPNCLNAKADVGVLGGFVGLSGRVMKGLVIGARAHYADFGTIEAVGADSGDLKGPIYTVYVDWEYGRW